jgi:polysaccharide pyruvyl transferase WcaK-like protein
MPLPLAGRARAAARGALRRVTRVDPLAYVPRRRRPPGTPPGVGLVGFYGWGNFGDELFAEVFREHLEPDLALRSLVHPGGFSLAERLGAGVRDSDAILIGGGDLVVPWGGSSRYWDRAYLRRPVFMSGLGVPLWRPPVPHVVARLALFFGHPNVRLIGVRDEESASWVRNHLGPSAPLVTTPDLVSALTFPAVQRPADAPVLGVAVRGGKTPDDLAHVRRLCRRALERGYRVRRIVLATGRTRAIDLRSVDALGLPDTELVASDDLAVISRAIGECTVFASMKFHGVIAAVMQGVTPLAMMPTTKNLNFLRAVDRADLLVPFTDPSLPDVLDRPLRPVDAADRDRLRDDSRAHLADLRARILEATAR